jgi:hypothetical protein
MTFTFKLEQADGTPAKPPSIVLGVYSWRTGDRLLASRHRRCSPVP